MEQLDQISGLLALVERPAFCVDNGKIILVNAAAQRHFICVGTEIAEFLPQDAPITVPPPEGYLYLTLRILDTELGASVFSIEDKLFFILEDENDDTRLQALALASQQLRQPLSGIMSAMDSLSENEKLTQDPQLQNQLSQINQRLFQMLRLVSNMSDAYRYRLDGSAQAETVNLTSLFHQIMESAQGLAEQAGRKLRFTQSRQVIFSLADRQMLEQAAYHLLSNAMKFSPKDSTITASLTQKGSTIYFTVQNIGEGLPQSLRGDLFSRYTRQPGIEDSRSGLGLGMSLVRTAALAHGGTLLMEQPQGQGLKVTMAIPVRQNNQSSVRTHMLCVDHAGGLPRGLIELADVLPAEAFANIH